MIVKIWLVELFFSLFFVGFSCGFVAVWLPPIRPRSHVHGELVVVLLLDGRCVGNKSLTIIIMLNMTTQS